MFIQSINAVVDLFVSNCDTNRSFLMWIPLDRARGHFCVFCAIPLYLIVVLAVGNDAADIYPFTDAWA